MPLGAARINTIGRYSAPTGRTALSISAVNNAQIDTAQSKFGGSSAYFDGTGDRLDVTHDTPLNIQTGDFTIEFWFRSPLTNIDGTYGDSLIGQTSSGANGGWIIRLFTTKLQWVWDNIGGYDVTFTFSANTWYHVAFVRSGTGMNCYINGTSYTVSGYSNNTNTSTNNVRVGKVYTGFSDDYTGHIDEIRISNVARYTGNFTSPTSAFTNDSNTVLLLHMDGTDAATNFVDDNGDRFRIGIRAINDAQVDTSQSKFGGASALFDGTGDYLIASSPQGFSTNNFTIEFWIRFNSTGANQLIAGGYPSGSPNLNWAFWMGSSNTFQYFLSSTGTSWDIANGVTIGTVTTNTWYHVALVRNGNTFTPYLDGTAATTSTSSSALYFNNTDWYIGGNTSYVMDGWIDELRISDIARYTANFTPSTVAFTNDANTKLLVHCNGADASKDFLDDNGAS